MGAYDKTVDPEPGFDYRPRVADAELLARLAATGAAGLLAPALLLEGDRPRLAFVASMGVLAWNTRWRQVTFVAGALFVFGVGASRVYLGVHYPADVVGGWCVAIASVAGTWLVGCRCDAELISVKTEPQPSRP